MQKALIEMLCCPVDQGYPLLLEELSGDGSEIASGGLRCGTCGTSYPIQNGIPNLLPAALSEVAAAAPSKHRESVARDADAPAYDANYPDYQSRLELQAILAALDVKPGDVVLDLGAGTGRVTGALARLGATVIATDISPRSLEINRARAAEIPGASVHYAVVDVCQLPLRDASWIKTACGGVLQSIEGHTERRRFAAEIHRVLAPGGRLALTTFNYSWSFRQRGTREGFYGDSLYYCRLLASELRHLFNSFEIRTLTGLVSLAKGTPPNFDRMIQALPIVATQTGDFLFIVADR